MILEFGRCNDATRYDWRKRTGRRAAVCQGEVASLQVAEARFGAAAAGGRLCALASSGVGCGKRWDQVRAASQDWAASSSCSRPESCSDVAPQLRDQMVEWVRGPHPARVST